MKINSLRQEKKRLIGKAKDIALRGENRTLTNEERAELDACIASLEDHEKRIRALEAGEDDEQQEVPAEQKSAIGRGRKTTPPAYGSFGIHSTEHRFSLHRAIRGCLEGGRPEGIERELSREVELKEQRSPKGLGFFLPFETRDTPTDTSTASGAQTYAFATDFLLLLRKQAILEKLGVQTVSGIHGLYRQPYENSGTTSQWVAEGSSVTADAMSVTYAHGQPRCLTTAYIASRQLLASSSYDMEATLIHDLVNATAEQLNNSFVNGDGSGATPTGMLSNTDIVPINLAGMGTTLAYGDALDLVATIQNANPPEGDTLTFLTSPNGSKTLLTTPRITGTSTAFPSFVQEADMIAGYSTVTSPQVPQDLTVGSPGTSDCTVLFFGDFREAARHLVWGDSVEILIDPFSLAGYNQVRVFALLTTDFIFPRPSLLTYAFFK